MAGGERSQYPNDPMLRRADNPVTRKPLLDQLRNHPLWKEFNQQDKWSIKIPIILALIGIILGLIGIVLSLFFGLLSLFGFTFLFILLSAALCFVVLIAILAKRIKQEPPQPVIQTSPPPNRNRRSPSQSSVRPSPVIQTSPPPNRNRRPPRRKFKSRYKILLLTVLALSSIGAYYMLSLHGSPVQEELFMVNNSSSSSNPLHSYNVVNFSQDGTYITATKDDGTMNIWDAANGELRHSYNSHDDQVDAIALSPDNTRIALADTKGVAQILNATNGEPVAYDRKPVAYDNGSGNSVNEVAWSPDGTHIASVNNDGTVQVRETNDGVLTFLYNNP